MAEYGKLTKDDCQSGVHGLSKIESDVMLTLPKIDGQFLADWRNCAVNWITFAEQIDGQLPIEGIDKVFANDVKKTLITAKLDVDVCFLPGPNILNSLHFGGVCE